MAGGRDALDGLLQVQKNLRLQAVADSRLLAQAPVNGLQQGYKWMARRQVTARRRHAKGRLWVTKILSGCGEGFEDTGGDANEGLVISATCSAPCIHTCLPAVVLVHHLVALDLLALKERPGAAMIATNLHLGYKLLYLAKVSPDCHNLKTSTRSTCPSPAILHTQSEGKCQEKHDHMLVHHLQPYHRQPHRQPHVPTLR